MKKIAAIHDLSGYGRASLTVAIPILSYMGYQVCPLPTAILSAHSEYRNFRSFDLSDQMRGIIDHWKELDLQFDALYSGYLASERQMNIVSDFFDHFGNDRNFILVDPVLGDHGELYTGMTPNMVKGMRQLCSKAKVITPNLTEAALLLDKQPGSATTCKETVNWCRSLSDLGPDYVIITSAPSGTAKKVATIAYNRKDVAGQQRLCCRHLSWHRRCLCQRNHRLSVKRRQLTRSTRTGSTFYQYGNKSYFRI